jgi:threonine dehydrogenase-like Zn-dependent dehydrogenase
MRALVMTAPGAMALESRTSHPTAADEAVITVIATGICGSDIHGLAGDTGRREVGQVMGHETVGRVREVGSEVDAGWLGALVTVNPVVACGECADCRDGNEQQCARSWVLGVRTDIDAAFAETVTVPARNLVRLPDDMIEWHGALIEPLAVGYHAAVRGGASPFDRVLVIGGGPIGQAVALACRRLGADRVLVSEPDPFRAGIIERLGFASTSPTDLPAGVESVLGAPATLVIDAVGNDHTLRAAFEQSTPGARVVLVGMASPTLGLSAYELSARERTVIGTFCYSHAHFRETAEWAFENPDVVALLSDMQVSLADADDVFGRLVRGELQANKVLVVP